MILETCKYFEGTGNFCSRVTAMRCDEFPECEFKYIAELKAEVERLQKLTCFNCGEETLNPSGAEIYDKILVYKQTLQEIKAIAEENKDTAQYGGICKSILDLITKAESEDNQ